MTRSRGDQSCGHALRRYLNSSAVHSASSRSSTESRFIRHNLTNYRHNLTNYRHNLTNYRSNLTNYRSDRLVVFGDDVGTFAVVFGDSSDAVD